MKKKIIAICILSVMIINALVIAVQAAAPNPYGTTSYGCITNIEMKSITTLRNDVTYFTSTVSSLQAGTGSTARPFETYGAIGGENTKLFVYSMGKNNNTDFTTKPVKTLMEQFAAENPDWIPLAAINGDFFDIESSNTPGIGEPENVMIQNGDIYKGHNVTSAGGGEFGIKPDGSVIYHINGFIETFTYTKGRYNLTVMNGDQTQTLGTHNRIPVDNPGFVTFIAPDSKSAADLTGKTVYVIACDTYRYAYRGGSGKVDPEGDYTYFFEGRVESVRAGSTNEKPAAGKVYISVPSGTETKLAANTYVKCNAVIGNNWADVENAMGFKQAILVNGDSSFVKGLTSSSSPTIKVADISYSVYNANRSAIGFKADGTPVILAIAKTDSKGATYYEMAEQLKALGCVYGFCLDGGGSTTMVIRNNSGAYETVFAGENGNTGRSVGNAIILAVPKNAPSNPGGNTGTTQNPDKDTEEKPSSGTTEKPTEKPTEPDLNNTFVEISKGNGYVAHSATAPTVTDTKLGITGYAGFTQNIVNSGYYFDDNKDGVKWNSSFLSKSDDATKAIAGDKAMDFNMEINIPELEAGEHTVSFMLKLADGTFVIIDTASFTVEAKQPSTPVTPPTPSTPAPSSSGCGGTIGRVSAIVIAIAAIPLFLRKKRK